MKVREIIATLIDVSNDLDAMEMFDDADVLTKTAQFFGDLGVSEPESNPDNDAAEYGFRNEDAFDAEQLARRDMENEDKLMYLESRINELKNKSYPTEDDLNELERLLDYRYGPNFDSQNVDVPTNEKDFSRVLENAGADVQNKDINPFEDA
jgi:hypothetical protein